MCAKCHFRLAIMRGDEIVAWSAPFANYEFATSASLWLRERNVANRIHVNTRSLTAWWEAHRGVVAIIGFAVTVKYLPTPTPAPARPASEPVPRPSWWKRVRRTLGWLMGISSAGLS